MNKGRREQAGAPREVFVKEPAYGVQCKSLGRANVIDTPGQDMLYGGPSEGVMADGSNATRIKADCQRVE